LQLALFGADLGNIDMKVTNRLGLEFFRFAFLAAFDIRQAGDIMTPKQAVQN